MDALVVGAGAMGRWFAEHVEGEVAFADVDADAAARAANAAGGRAAGLDGDESFDLVCVAVPMPDAADAIAAQAGRASQAVVDVTGVMGEPLAAMAEGAPDRERMSLHPLFAPPRAPGTVAVAYGAPGPATDRVRDWLDAAGNDVVETTPDEHDDAMRTVQGRAHAAVLAFALAAEDVPDALATPIYDRLTDLVDTVTDGNARVYADVQETFGGAGDVAAAARALADADPETFAALYEDARPTADADASEDDDGE